MKSYVILLLVSLAIRIMATEVEYTKNERPITSILAHRINYAEKGTISGYLGIGDWNDISNEYKDFDSVLSDKAMYSDNEIRCHMPGYVIRVTYAGGADRYFDICLHCNNLMYTDGAKKIGMINLSRNGLRYFKSIYMDAFILKDDLNFTLTK